ncbi:hypothetical protein [Dialister sp.]|uniref:hypothetical protein n=1 Tax=Dialister sp. TaxID=1955814 RepID=UPI003F0D1B80
MKKHRGTEKGPAWCCEGGATDNTNIIYCSHCKGCLWAAKGGKGYQKGLCEFYPKMKPAPVMFEGADCPYYEVGSFDGGPEEETENSST